MDVPSGSPVRGRGSHPAENTALILEPYRAPRSGWRRLETAVEVLFVIVMMTLLLAGTTWAQSPGTPITSLPSTTIVGNELVPVAQPAANCGVIPVFGSPSYCGASVTLNAIKAFTGGGGGGTPGGSNGQIQFNNSGSFGGISPTGSGLVVEQTSPTLITPLLGTPTSVVLTNGTGLPFSTGLTGTLALGSQVSGQLGVTNGGTASSTAPTSAQILIAQSGSLYAPETMGQDCTITTSGTMTCLKTNNVAFGTLAVANAATPPSIGGTTPNSITVTTINSMSVPGGSGSLGFLGLPTQTKSGNYTFALADAGTVVTLTTGSFTFTIPANSSVAFPNNNNNCLIMHAAAGATLLTIAITTDTLNWSQNGTTTLTGSRTLAPYGWATICKIDNSTTWQVLSWIGMSFEMTPEQLHTLEDLYGLAA